MEDWKMIKYIFGRLSKIGDVIAIKGERLFAAGLLNRAPDVITVRREKIATRSVAWEVAAYNKLSFYRDAALDEGKVQLLLFEGRSRDWNYYSRMADLALNATSAIEADVLRLGGTDVLGLRLRLDGDTPRLVRVA